MSTNKHIYLCLAKMSDTGMEQKYIQEAFDTNWVVPLGPNVNGFERDIEEYLRDKRKVVALSSCTAALHLALMLLGVGRDDEVMCQDLSFIASSNPVTYCGAKPVFIDSDPDTWNMDPELLEKAINDRMSVTGRKPKAIIVVDLYGMPAKWDELSAISKRYGIPIIEDAANAMGSFYRGDLCGLFGNIATFSFNGNKIITTSGGGALLCDTPETKQKTVFLSTQARENCPYYQHEVVGYNYRMSNIIAGVVRGQMNYIDEHIAQKKAIYERYREGFKGLPVTMNPFDGKNSEPNYWLSCMLIDKEAMCRQVRSENEPMYISEYGKTCPTEILETLAKYNAEGRPIWKPMHMQPIYRMNGFVTASGNGRGQSNAYIDRGEAVDIGADIFERGLCLPSDNKMTAEEQDIIIELIRSCFE